MTRGGLTKLQAMLWLDLNAQILARYSEMFPNYAWSDPQMAVDLMTAEITTVRAENASLQEALREAPHDRRCFSLIEPIPGATSVRNACDCWKARVVAEDPVVMEHKRGCPALWYKDGSGRLKQRTFIDRNACNCASPKEEPK